MTATLTDVPPLERGDALQGWYDARMGLPLNPIMASLSPAYQAGFAWEITQFVRDPCRCTPVVPRKWHGHDKVIRQQIRQQLDRDLPADRFDRVNKGPR